MSKYSALYSRCAQNPEPFNLKSIVRRSEEHAVGPGQNLKTSQAVWKSRQQILRFCVHP